MRTLIAIAVLTACTTPATRHEPTSRGPRVGDHLARAGEHEARAGELALGPDRRSMQDPDAQLAAGRWYRRLDTAEAQRWAARRHRGEAAAMQAELDEACADRPSIEMALSPLQRYGKGGTTTEHGVLVFLSRYAGTADELMAEIRCHRAWMMMAPMPMEACPLDLPNLEIEARGDASGVTVEISTRDAALLPELQRRTMLDLESARIYLEHHHE